MVVNRVVRRGWTLVTVYGIPAVIPAGPGGALAAAAAKGKKTPQKLERCGEGSGGPGSRTRHERRSRPRAL